MSERGSFVTSYIYCPKCLAVLKDLFVQRTKILCSTLIPTWDDNSDSPLPIIAGKVGASAEGGEIYFIEDIAHDAVLRICCEVRITVLCDSGITALLTLDPRIRGVYTILFNREGEIR